MSAASNTRQLWSSPHETRRSMAVDEEEEEEEEEEERKKSRI